MAPLDIDGISAGRSEERSWVTGGSSAMVLLEPGDRLTITDLEGLQPIDLFVFDAAGGEVPGALGLSTTIPALGGFSGLLDGAAVRHAAAARGIDPARVTGLSLGEPSPVPGAARTLTAERSVLCVVAAPGAAMTVDGPPPPTDLALSVARAAGSAVPLPAALAEPKAEYRIKAATARSFRVSAGDYIQIIDVEGKQCSDFLAFDAAALARGEETGLDATTTRTLLGISYPLPGLHSKYFDAGMRPLVEVVRDTVGRHDTFALACTAKYYEDLGYPGHPSCSENFNVTLAEHGIVPRKGWPAINFFFNTAIDAHGALVSDEPWTQPGDYVMMRALTDLVCATSSCADDIDASNAWTPTDIHVRIYDAANDFSKGIATRMTPDSEPKLTRDTAFHPRSSALTRSFVEYRGYWLPTCFSQAGPIEEYWACRERAAIMDLSPLRKFEILGPDAEALLQATVTRDVSKIAVGQVVYTAMCYDHGGMIDDGTVFRLTPSNFRWVCGDEYCGVWLREQAEKRGLKAWVKSSTDHLHNVAVQGPASRAILSEIVWTPPTQPSLADLKWFRFLVGRLGGPQGIPLLVSRTGYTGELGYEVWVHPKDAPSTWDAIMAAGEPHGISPLGLSALDMVRIEAGLAFAGYEFCDQTDPYEAGIGFAVADKAADFVGKAALAERKAHSRRKLVGLEIDGNDGVGHGDPIYLGRAQIGVITSATRSPKLDRWIALARLDATYGELGSSVEIGKLDGHQKRIGATVVRFPHYDPEKTRVRA